MEVKDDFSMTEDPSRNRQDTQESRPLETNQKSDRRIALKESIVIDPDSSMSSPRKPVVAIDRVVNREQSSELMGSYSIESSDMTSSSSEPEDIEYEEGSQSYTESSQDIEFNQTINSAPKPRHDKVAGMEFLSIQKNGEDHNVKAPSFFDSATEIRSS